MQHCMHVSNLATCDKNGGSGRVGCRRHCRRISFVITVQERLVSVHPSGLERGTSWYHWHGTTMIEDQDTYTRPSCPMPDQTLQQPAEQSGPSC
jgi:hypothetical protein